MIRRQVFGRFSLTVVGLIAAAVVANTAAALGASSRLPTVVASGRWDGHAWSLRAGDDFSGGQIRHCYQISVDFAFTTAAPPRHPNCGTVLAQSPRVPSTFPYGVSFGSLSPCPIAFVEGIVVARATQVRITLASGTTVRISAVSGHAPLSQDVKYFVSRVPCGSSVSSLIGLDSRGKTVARVTLHH
jgi:hypothetical protein